MGLISLLSAFGVGSLVTTFVNFYVSQRSKDSDRQFTERKEAFVGLLNSYRRAAVEGTDDAAKEFAYWQMRCELVASERVRKAIEAIVSTNGDNLARNHAHEHLKSALRADLGILK